MIKNDQQTVPKQDAGENVVISSAPNAKLKNKGTRRSSKNSESGSDGRQIWKCENCQCQFYLMESFIQVELCEVR